jgi:hypothetical protein
VKWAKVFGGDKGETDSFSRADYKPTGREMEVLQPICEGHSCKSIALLLGVGFISRSMAATSAAASVIGWGECGTPPVFPDAERCS